MRNKRIGKLTLLFFESFQNAPAQALLHEELSNPPVDPKRLYISLHTARTISLDAEKMTRTH